MQVSVLWKGQLDQTPRDPCTKANVTLVSAFFDIGDHGKGGGIRRMSEYLTFSKPLSLIRYDISMRYEENECIPHL